MSWMFATALRCLERCAHARGSQTEVPTNEGGVCSEGQRRKRSTVYTFYRNFEGGVG